MNPNRVSNVKTKLLPDGHVVVYSENTDWAHVLTPQAALVWEFCDGEHSVDQIIQELQAIGEAHSSALNTKDIPTLLSELKDNGLLEFK